MDDVLDELEPYFEELGFNPEEEEYKIRELYDLFYDDFIKNPFKVNNTYVAIKEAFSQHLGQPDYFNEFKHDFVHIITRLGDITRRRIFEPQRTNRIHWIKPILVNSSDSRI